MLLTIMNFCESVHSAYSYASK